MAEALSDLEVELREAEVLWGKEAVRVEKEFDDKVRKLRADVYLFLRGHNDETLDKRIYDIGENDEFTKALEATIQPIEEFLEPYLSRRKGRAKSYLLDIDSI